MIGKINIDTLLADAAYQIEPKDVNAAYIEAGGGLGTFLEVCCRFDTMHHYPADPVINSPEFIKSELEDLAKQLDERKAHHE